MNEVWVGLVGVIVGFILQAVNGWLTERRAEQRNHRQWLRQVRYENYTALPDAMRDMLRALRQPWEPGKPNNLSVPIAAVNSARTKALMVADEDTSERLQNECLKFAVVMKDNQTEAEAIIGRLTHILAPRITSIKEPKSGQLSPIEIAADLLAWDDVQKSKNLPGLNEQERGGM